MLDADSVVIRHADALDGAGIRGLSSALQDAQHSSRERPLWAALTLDATTHSSDLLHLLQLFPRTVEVPPLRLHLEDLPLLVQLFLSRLGQGGHLVCSPEAMRLLMRMSWPGNAEQVHQVLREVVKHRRTGSIEPEDLPPEVHTVSRRVLSPLEAIERDAIVRCLVERQRQQGPGSAVAGDVPGNDLPQGPRLRNRRPARLTSRLTLRRLASAALSSVAPETTVTTFGGVRRRRMESTPSIAMPLLQAGILMGIVLWGNVVAVRHLPTEDVPGVLRGRIELCNRLRPWLIVAACAMTMTGLVLQLA